MTGFSAERARVDGIIFLIPARWCGVCWWMNSCASSSPKLELATVLRALRGSVGGWGGLGLLAPVLGLLLFRRLGEVCRDMDRLLARFRDGRLRRVAARGAVGFSVDGRRRAVLARVWPGRFGWLLRAVAYRAAVYGGQLRVVLEQPEMVALLIAAPQAARILRPVCRMLAVETSLLRPRLPGSAVEVVVVAPEVKVRVRRPRLPVDWGRVPLPRGVLTAARRQGFGKC